MRQPVLPALIALLLLGHGAAAAGRRHAHSGHHGHPGHPAAAAHPAAHPAPKPTPKAPEAAAPADDEVESIEVPAAGDGAAAAAGGPPAAGDATDHLSAQQWVAHLHPALVHLPIAWSLLWALGEAAAAAGVAGLALAIRWLAWATVASFVPAVITGLLHVAELPADPESMRPVLLHRNIMYGALAACLVLAIGRERAARREGPPARWQRAIYAALLAGQMGAVGFGAHLGGKLVYGDSYLPFF